MLSADHMYRRALYTPFVDATQASKNILGNKVTHKTINKEKIICLAAFFGFGRRATRMRYPGKTCRTNAINAIRN